MNDPCLNFRKHTEKLPGYIWDSKFEEHQMDIGTNFSATLTDRVWSCRGNLSMGVVPCDELLVLGKAHIEFVLRCVGKSSNAK